MKKNIVFILAVLIVSTIGVFGYYLVGNNIGVSADKLSPIPQDPGGIIVDDEYEPENPGDPPPSTNSSSNTSNGGAGGTSTTSTSTNNSGNGGTSNSSTSTSTANTSTSGTGGIGGTTGSSADFNFEPIKPETLKEINYSPGSWEKLGSNTLNLLSYIAGTALIIMLLVGGVMYITSAGNDEQAQKAKNILIYASIGITIVAVAYSVVIFIANTIK